MSISRNRDLIVVKFGSDLIANGHGVDMGKIDGYARGLAKQLERRDILVVTSGAVAAGRAIVHESGLAHEHEDTFNTSVLAGIGSTAVMSAWQESFGEYGVLAASFLVTHHEIAEELEGGKLKDTLAESIANGVVPVVNENDALSDVEIMELHTGGDNDGLAAHLALTTGAVGLRLFTIGGGLHNEQGQHIPVINHSNIEAVSRMLSDRSLTKVSSNGRGGMKSKVRAAYNFVNHDETSGRWAEISKPDNTMTGTRITRILR